MTPATEVPRLDLSHANLRKLLEGAGEVQWARVAHLRCEPYRHEVWLGLCLDLTRVAKRAGVEQIPAPARLLELVDRQATVSRRNRYAWRF